MEIKTVFMGSSTFSVKILECLVKAFPVCGVITQPDRPAGRGKVLTSPPVKTLAESLEIPVFQPLKLRLPESFEILRNWKPDLIIVAAYGQILRPKVLELPKWGCINVHASYLPRWRGAAPIQAAILNGDDWTGVTIMKMDDGIDTGPELAKKKVHIDKHETSLSLSEKLAVTGGGLLVETLLRYIKGEIEPVAQDNHDACYASMIRKEEGALDFNQSAVVLERKVRAFIDWPGTFMKFQENNLKIRMVEVVRPGKLDCGRRGIGDGFPLVGTADGDLKLLEIQPAGKKWMSGLDFLRGTHNWIENNTIEEAN